MAKMSWLVVHMPLCATRLVWLVSDSQLGARIAHGPTVSFNRWRRRFFHIAANRAGARSPPSLSFGDPRIKHIAFNT